MSYRVFARKYRPQTFEEVVGQEHITRTLQNAISAGRVAQAYLFVGPRGIGKTSSARILAKALNCVQGPTPTPCGVCDSCREIAEGRNLDVLEIDGASNNSVDNIRDLRDSAAYAPSRGPYKVYLIDEVHMLSSGAFNALLKTLEEPPEHVKFIFATTEAQKVPATITSRCQRFDLRRIPTIAIARHLLGIAEKENIQLEEAAADAIARAAEGGLRDAESMLDQAVAFCGDTITQENIMEIFGFTPKEITTAFIDAILAADARKALEVISGQAESGRDLSRMLAEAIIHLRDRVVTQAGTGDSKDQGRLLVLLDHFAETETRMRWASDKKLQLDVAAIKGVHLLQQVSLDDVISTLSSLASGTPLTASAPRPAPTPALPVERKAPEPVAAPKPSPAPVAAAAPQPAVPPPAPVAPRVAATQSDAVSVDASVAWQQVADGFQSSFVYRWLSAGVFGDIRGNTVRILLPLSCQKELESIVGEKGRRESEARLSEQLGRKIQLVLELSDSVAEVIGEEEESFPEPEPPIQVAPPPRASEPQPAPPSPSSAPANTMEDFKNDPLIKKALEIFRGEIQTQS